VIGATLGDPHTHRQPPAIRLERPGAEGGGARVLRQTSLQKAARPSVSALGCSKNKRGMALSSAKRPRPLDETKGSPRVV
jgi:hypothetical protein